MGKRNDQSYRNCLLQPQILGQKKRKSAQRSFENNRFAQFSVLYRITKPDENCYKSWTIYWQILLKRKNNIRKAVCFTDIAETFNSGVTLINGRGEINLEFFDGLSTICSF